MPTDAGRSRTRPRTWDAGKTRGRSERDAGADADVVAYIRDLEDAVSTLETRLPLGAERLRKFRKQLGWRPHGPPENTGMTMAQRNMNGDCTEWTTGWRISITNCRRWRTLTVNSPGGCRPT